MRLLITGSRMWTDWNIIGHALAAEWLATDGRAILVSGNCPPRPDGTPGADYICETIWGGWGGTVERYPANWKQHDNAAGHIRNGEMVLLLDVYKCLAFNLNRSRGTADCMNKARKNNIPVSLFEKWTTRDEDLLERILHQR
jgi:hypothetical protein